MLERFQDGFARQIVEQDPAHRFVFPDFLGDMPCDRLSLAVRVRRQQDLLRAGRRLLQVGNDLFLGIHHHIRGFEPVFRIDPQFVFREIFHMAHGCAHLIFLAEVFADGSHLGRRFDDDQCIQFVHPLRRNCFPGI